VIEKIDRYYLEITSIDKLKDKQKPIDNLKIDLLKSENFELNKFFYKQIGKKYQWVDRLAWSDATWQKYTANKNLKTYVLKENNNLIGFFELIYNNEAFDCEIAYFGIFEEFFSKGYGGYLLSEAIKLGFQSNVKRVWVHTCSLDHPNAILNYKSRGMQVFKNEILKRQAI
jgi:ribosomal protein S18 acetylase RimI-like enzyme